MMFFWVLDLCKVLLWLKSRPFIAIATIQDRDADENAIMVVCVCAHAHSVHMVMFYRGDERSRLCGETLTTWLIFPLSHWLPLHTGPPFQCSVTVVVESCQRIDSYL